MDSSLDYHSMGSQVGHPASPVFGMRLLTEPSSPYDLSVGEKIKPEFTH